MGPKKFAEPVSLSSTLPADLPLPRTACRRSFVLLALRARRKWQPSRSATAQQDRRETRFRSLRAFCFRFSDAALAGFGPVEREAGQQLGQLLELVGREALGEVAPDALHVRRGGLAQFLVA